MFKLENFYFMAKEKENKAKNDSDSQKTGNSCGFSLGCLIIIIAILAIIFFIFLKPALEDAGYTYGDLEDKFFALKDKTSATFEKTDQLLEQGKEKYENIKGKTTENLDNLKDLDDKTREEVNKLAPKLIAD